MRAYLYFMQDDYVQVQSHWMSVAWSFPRSSGTVQSRRRPSVSNKSRAEFEILKSSDFSFNSIGPRVGLRAPPSLRRRVDGIPFGC